MGVGETWFLIGLGVVYAVAFWLAHRHVRIPRRIPEAPSVEATPIDNVGV